MLDEGEQHAEICAPEATRTSPVVASISELPADMVAPASITAPVPLAAPDSDGSMMKGGEPP